MESRRTFYHVALVAALSAATFLWGLARDLPYVPNVDEHLLVAPAVRMASRGSWNPRWFGNPGSTVIYPLSFIYSAWSTVAGHARPFHADRSLERRFARDPADFYLLGRGLSVAYAVGGAVATYALGRAVFGGGVGLAGALLSVAAPVTLWSGRLVRTDMASVFFGMLALVACTALLARGNRRRQIAAGAAIGLAVSTRYFSLAFLPVLLAADAVLVWRSPRGERLARVADAALGIACVAIAFLVSTPFFLVDLERTLENLRFEARPTSLGADGLTPWGNLVFYLTDALPENLGRVQLLAAAIGAAAVLWKRDARELLLVLYVAVFLVAISASSLHWTRWIIQVSPVLSLLAASAIGAGSRWLAAMRVPPTAAALALFGAAIAEPAYATALVDYRDSRPSTYVLAREWIVDHLPHRSRIVVESIGPPVPDGAFDVLHLWRLDASPDVYCARGYRYVALGLYFYSAAAADPLRHPVEVANYRRLFTEGRLLAEFPWERTRGGATVRVYELRCEGSPPPGAIERAAS